VQPRLCLPLTGSPIGEFIYEKLRKMEKKGEKERKTLLKTIK
jgi:hypothetical protein